MTVTNDLSVHFVIFYNNGKYPLDYLIDAAVPKKVLLSMYDLCIKYEYFMPIELLQIEDKKELVSKCRETGLTFTNQSLTDASKILYTINFINENS